MHDSLTTAVIETDLEVEARIYEGMLCEAGLHAQVRTIEDPVLTNVIRQIALPRFQVVVLTAEAVAAMSIIAAERQTAAENVTDPE